MMDGNTWLITLTNQRVVFLDKGMLFGVKQVDVNLPNIVSVGGKTGLLLGEITISTSGQNYTIKNVAKTSVIPFTNLVNEARNIKTSSTPLQFRILSNPNPLMRKCQRLKDWRK